MTEYCGEDGSLGRVIDELRKVEEEGPRICSVCRQTYIVPRAERVEFWMSPDWKGYTDFGLPFLRRACSPGCADDFDSQ